MQKLRRRFSSPVGNVTDVARQRSNSTEPFGRHSVSLQRTVPLRPAARPSEPLLSSFFSSSSGKSRRNLEAEQRALMDQINALQSTMRGLADMLREQDGQLETASTHTSKLTEELNRLADENVDLRRQITEQRRLKNSAWEELQIYKMAARTRRDKLILQQRAMSNLAKQKDDLAKFSQDLLAQLTEERKKEKQRRATLKYLAEDDRRFSTVSVDFDDLEQETESMMAQFHETLAAAPVELSSDLKPTAATPTPTAAVTAAAAAATATGTATATAAERKAPSMNGTYLGRPNIDVEMESPRRTRSGSHGRELSPDPFPAAREPHRPSTNAQAPAVCVQRGRMAVTRTHANPLIQQKQIHHLDPPKITEEDFLSSSDEDDEFAFFNASPSTPISFILSSIESKFQDANDGHKKVTKTLEKDAGSGAPHHYKPQASTPVAGMRIGKARGTPVAIDSPAADGLDPTFDIMVPYANPFDSLKMASPNSSPKKQNAFFPEKPKARLEVVDEDLRFMEESFHEDEAPELTLPNTSPSKSRKGSARKRSSLSQSYSHSQSHSALDELWSSEDDSD